MNRDTVPDEWRCECDDTRSKRRCRKQATFIDVRGWRVCGWHHDWARYTAPARGLALRAELGMGDE